MSNSPHMAPTSTSQAAETNTDTGLSAIGLRNAQRRVDTLEGLLKGRDKAEFSGPHGTTRLSIEKSSDGEYSVEASKMQAKRVPRSDTWLFSINKDGAITQAVHKEAWSGSGGTIENKIKSGGGGTLRILLKEAETKLIDRSIPAEN